MCIIKKRSWLEGFLVRHGHWSNNLDTRMSSESQIRPLGDRVVVRPLTEEERGTTSPSGIIIPDTAKQEKPEQGVVIAVGTGKWNEDGDSRIAPEVKEGDRVMFSKYGYDEVKVGEQEYYIVSESNILAVITSA